MPCPSYDIPASACKSGSSLAKVPGTICHICYAKRGNYQWPVVQRAQERRLASLDHPQWVDAMVTLIMPHRYFRWHSSGDIQSLYHFYNICAVAEQTPRTKHWLPTKEMEYVGLFVPKNLTIRYSIPVIDGRPRKIACAIVVTHDWDCPADTQDNHCGTCRRCWDKRVKVIRYKKH